MLSLHNRTHFCAYKKTDKWLSFQRTRISRRGEAVSRGQKRGGGGRDLNSCQRAGASVCPSKAFQYRLPCSSSCFTSVVPRRSHLTDSPSDAQLELCTGRQNRWTARLQGTARCLRRFCTGPGRAVRWTGVGRGVVHRRPKTTME